MRVEVVDSHVEDFVTQVARFVWTHFLNKKKEVRLNYRLFRYLLRNFLYISVNLLHYLFNIDLRRKLYLLILLFCDILQLQSLRDNADFSFPIDLDPDIANYRPLAGKDIHII